MTTIEIIGLIGFIIAGFGILVVADLLKDHPANENATAVGPPALSSPPEQAPAANQSSGDVAAAGCGGADGSVPVEASPTPLTVDRLLDAIRMVESGGNVNAVGDRGRSRGAYQISAAYWSDAFRALPRQRNYRRYVKDDGMCRMVIVNYWLRYAHDATVRLDLRQGTLADCETLARVHNGGPDGMLKPATQVYWAKVRVALEKP